MAQRTTNFYRLVTLPSFYKSLHVLLGAERARARYVREVIQPKPGNRVLDVGCGPATLVPYLAGVLYTGIDLNPKHIEHAKALHGDKGRFLVGDATRDLTGEPDAFDLIIVSALLHHLADDKARAMLSSLFVLLKPGGRLVTMDSIWLPHQNPIAWAFNKLDSGLNVRTAEGYLSLVSGLPATIDTRTYRDFFRIPYDHFCMILAKTDAILDQTLKIRNRDA